MEKFIKVPVLKVVLSGTATTPVGVTLTDTGAAFTQRVLINAIVHDRTTATATGGQMYIVTAITSDTVLALTAIGPTAAQGTGVPAAAAYYIYMPEKTVLQYGTTSSTEAKFLVDTSGVDFVSAGVQIGDSITNIIDGVVTSVTSVSVTKLGVLDDVFTNNETYIVSRVKPDNFEELVRTSNLSNVGPIPAVTSGGFAKIQYDVESSDFNTITYALSDTGAIDQTKNFYFQSGIQDAAVSAYQQPWSDISVDFVPPLNTYDSSTNATWLGGREYFILRVF